MLEQVLSDVAPDAAALGCSNHVARCRAIVGAGTSADAQIAVFQAHEKNEILTGVFYIDTKKPTFIDQLDLVDEPLGTLPESLTRPPKSALESLMASLQ